MRNVVAHGQSLAPDGAAPDRTERLGQTAALGRAAQAEEIASVVAFLASAGAPTTFRDQMSETPFAVQGPYQRGIFRWGMLLLIVALWSAAWWTWLTRAPRDRSGPTMNLVVTSMLLVNHVIASFLSVERQNRVRLVQFIFIGACALYVFRTAFHS